MKKANKTECVVQGRVTDGNERRLPKLLVRAFDRDMRSMTLLGECLTDSRGEYQIVYSVDKFRSAEKQSADLSLKVFGPRGKNLYHETALDGTVFNASDRETIDITISGAMPAEENEFDLVLGEVNPMLDKVALTGLQENEKNHDVSFLSRETGIAAEKINHLSVAHSLAALTKADADFFYALLRKNTLLKNDITRSFNVRFFIDLNTDFELLLFDVALLDPKVIKSDVASAHEGNLVPDRTPKNWKKNFELLSKFKSKGQTYYRTEYPQKVLTVLGSFIEKDKTAQIGKILSENKQDLDASFKKIASLSFLKPGAKPIDAEVTVGLAQVLGFDEGLLAEVIKAQKIKTPEDTKKLAAMNKADWKKLLAKVAGKAKVAGQPVDRKVLDFHASALVRKMEKEFPSVAFSAQLQREKKKIFANQDSLKSLFAKHPDFDLAKTNIDLFLKKKKLATQKNEGVRRELKSVQRVFKLIPNYGKTNALLKRNIHSAQGITALGQGRFLKEIAPVAELTEKEATDIYRRAETVTTAAMLVAGDLQDAMNGAEIAALGMNSLSLKVAAASDDFPNLKSLFKMTDTCACEHCRSVYSPAAYLVELLQFLDKRIVSDLTVTPHGVSNAKDVLFDRRPDLGDIDLGCENANTPMPYIDLVCELLEEAVSPDPGFIFNGVLSDGADPLKGKISNGLFTAIQSAGIPITRDALVFETETSVGSPTTLPHYIRDKESVCKAIRTAPNTYRIHRLRQTLWPAEELAAAPAYVNPAAYNELLNNSFAFKLPFDLAHTEAKAYFSRFDIKRHDLMEDLQSAGVPAANAIAAEHLGLTDAERLLVVSPDAANQQDYWNTAAANAANELKIVSKFLDKTGLTYKELVLLLKLKFIDPSNDLFIRHLDLTCDTDQKEIANLSNAALDRIHRFLRLQKKTKWSFETLDEIISQPRLGNGALDDPCLVKAATLLKISEITGIKIDELTGFYRRLPHIELSEDGKKPLYHQVFLNKAKNGFIENGLTVESVNAGAQMLVNLKKSIAVCLQMSEKDLDKLLPPSTYLPSGSVSFENLSRLFAAARLIKKLRLKAQDFIILVQLTAINVTDSPEKTLEFIEKATEAMKFPLKIADLRFMIRHESEDPLVTDLEIKDDKVKLILEQLQAAFKKAQTANVSPFDPNMAAVEQKEALASSLAKLSGMSEEDVKDFSGFIETVTSPAAATAANTSVDAKLSDLFSTTDIKAKLTALGATPPATDPPSAAALETAQKNVVKAFLDAISNYLYVSEITGILTQTMSASFKADTDTAAAVLTNAKLKQPAPGTEAIGDILLKDVVLTASPISPAALPQQYDALRLLHKLFPLIKSCKLTADTTEWHLKNNQTLGWFELDKIPYKIGQAAIGLSTYADFKKILDIAKLLTPVPNPADAENPITFYSLAAMLLAATLRNAWIEAYSLLTGYAKADIDALDAHLFAVFSLNNYRNPKTWESIDKCARHLRTLGVTLAQAKEFVKPALVAADAAAARMALKARYDEDTWLSTLKEVMDAIRPQKRNALVAYLLATDPNLKDENGLFDHFLVDVEMESCMPSSRIVQAHGTIQLFAQRCLMGLEPESAANINDDPNWEQWKWMKNYRVWEANRKVFLYPENWIEAELRDDKSFLFKELENELLQNEVNDYNSEQALIRYLEKLDDIAFLEVMATWYQVNIRTMHVFARTKGGDPAIYYYRRFEQERYWTPWEKVDLDISGDHLLAFMRNNRLCLAWPVFTEEPDPDVKATVPDINDPGEQSTDKPKRKLKIQIAISELANKIWQPKRVSKDAIKTPDSYTPDPLPVDNYTFAYVQFFDQIWLINNASKEGDQYWLSGVFEVAGCKGYPELLQPWNQTYLNDFYPDFRDTSLKVQKYKEQNKDALNDLAVRNGFFLYNYLPLLQNTPGNFRITYPHQFTEIDLLMLILQLIFANVNTSVAGHRYFKWPVGTFLPYFMEDSKHAYVIIPGAYQSEVDETTGESAFTLKRTASNFFDTLDSGNFLAILVELIVWYLAYGERFMNMYHPLVCPLKTTLYKHGIPKLMERDTQLQESTFNFAAAAQYNPTPLVPEPRPVEDIDFNSDGSYSSYNWELFFHVPFLLATRLTKNQRFEEAMTWFHYIFNPTGALDGDAPQKYWVTKPFFLTHDSDYINQRIDTLLYNVSNPATPAIKTELEFAIDQWRAKPFKPHVVARFRTVAYQKAVLMKYIDMLTEWGDYLFRQDTMESIAQATQMYIMADKLLGPKPRIVPPAVKPPYETYDQIEQKIDAFGNALIDLENILPDLTATPEGGADLPPAPVTLSTLYFCVPPNDQMLAYWDRIADRLFKIRNCQNIDGIERSLALFAPPIDPGMLVRAAASGLDLSAVLGGLNAPAPYYRFSVLSQKATELIQEVRGLGSALLAALEKKDAEAMALLRSELELKVLKAVRDMKTLQIKEAKEQINILNKTKAVTEERKKYYQNIKKIIPNEQLNLDKLSEAQDLQFKSQIVRTVAGALALIPEFHVGASGFGGSPKVVMQLGGSALSKATSVGADILNILSGIASFEANRASILGGYDRRFDDWKLQERLATKELIQIDRQIVAAEIRRDIAETDLKNHDLQIENAEKTDEFMHSKFTNKDLYDWMIGQISSVYFRAYQLAFDTAKKAERCYKFELGNDDTFLGFGYWDSMKKGLQSADMLFHDLKRMEASYLDKNKREYEITKHISLAMLDPLALAQMRATGVCNFEIPEAIYDMDHPGQYFRRVKSVSLSLPCIAGPYTSVSAKLSLVSNKYRKNTNPDNAAGTGYAEDTGNDERFVYNVGSIQSIAASNSQNDSGMFELNFRDERYLPFEGCGAIGTLRLELPADVRQFDYETIADAVIHVKYTAREGGGSLKNVAAQTLKERLFEIKQQLSQTGLHLAINLKHEMPNEWHLFKQDASVQLTLDKSRLPYFTQSLDATIENVIFLARVKNNPANCAITIDGAAPTNLSRIDAWKLCRGENADIDIDTQFSLAVAAGDIGNLEDLMMVVKYEFPTS